MTTYRTHSDHSARFARALRNLGYRASLGTLHPTGYQDIQTDATESAIARAARAERITCARIA